jgi:3-hydroxyacyl-[acyl-carrier-protein] dehydratase
MNYIFVDKIIALDKGKQIKAVKGIPRTEDYLDEYYPRCSLIPSAVIIESLASAAGLLVLASTQFECLTLLTKIEEAVFTNVAQPGDQMILDVKLVSLHEMGAQLEGMIYVDGQEAASAGLVMSLLEVQAIADSRTKCLLSSLLKHTKKWMQHILVTGEIE